MAVATISVNFSTLAQVREGASTVTSINPKQLRDALNSGSNFYDINIKGLTTNGNATINGTINATSGYAGNFVASGSVSGTGWNGNLAVTGNISATTGWAGNLTISGSIFASGGYAGTLDVTGNIRATQDVIAYYSDSRLKDVKGEVEHALDKVNALKGVLYTHNELAKTFGFTETDQKVGLIAQDVQSVLPEAIKLAPFDTGENGESKSGKKYLTVQYHLIVPLLVEAIKQLSKKVDLLESQNRGK